MFRFVVLQLLVFHGVDGSEVTINPAEIVSMHERRTGGEEKQKYFVEGVQCLINTSDGKFVTVIEHCADVRAAIADEIKRLQEQEP